LCGLDESARDGELLGHKWITNSQLIDSYKASIAYRRFTIYDSRLYNTMHSARSNRIAQSEVSSSSAISERGVCLLETCFRFKEEKRGEIRNPHRGNAL
jgi:hypothetical protein